MCTVTHMEFSYQAYKKCCYINENAIAYICCNKTAKHLNLKGSQTKLYHSQHNQAAALIQTDNFDYVWGKQRHKDTNNYSRGTDLKSNCLPQPRATPNSQCTHKNTPQIFHSDSWTVQQLHTGMGMLLCLPVLVFVCVVRVSTSLHIAQSDTNQHRAHKHTHTQTAKQSTRILMLANRCAMTSPLYHKWWNKCYAGQMSS